MSLININFIISALVIIAVFVLQYVFNMAPCDMCLVERYPYYLLIIIGFAGIVYLLSCYLLGLLKIKSYKTK